MAEGNEKLVLYHEILASDNISQGDILFKFPLMLPDPASLKEVEEVSKKGMEAKIRYKIYETDLIILTQACDLVNNDKRSPIKSVVCAKIQHIGKYSIDNVRNVNAHKIPSFYLLNKDDEHMEKSHLIEFKSIHTIPYDLLSKFAQASGNRIRPVSPILEKISQQFGNFFSRIGLEYERDPKELKEEHEKLV